MKSQSVFSADPLVAMAVVLALKTQKEDQRTVRGLSEILASFQEDYDLTGISIGPSGEGYYSDDVESFVSRLRLSGEATQKSPITLDSEGETYCIKLVKREISRNPSYAELARKKGIDLG